MNPLTIARYGFITILVLTFGAAFWHISGLRADLAESENEAERLEAIVESQTESIQQLERDRDDIQKLNNELNEAVAGQTEDISNLRDRFFERPSGEMRDFANLAFRRPDSVERIVNEATKNAVRCVEIASGSELTEDEKNGIDINQECPSIANPVGVR